MYKKPNINELKNDLDKITKATMYKQASVTSALKAAAPFADPVGDVIEGVGTFAGSALEAGASTLNTVADLAKESVGWATAAAAASGVAAAYLAYRLNKPNATDIDIDRSNLYKAALKTKIREIRRKQTIDQNRQAAQVQNEPTLRY
jgi:ABC-type transporter Mla subunit MlaD